MYDDPMRRVNIHLDENVDQDVAAEAARRGMSKAALIRDLIGQGIGRSSADPIDALIAVGHGTPVDDIDQVLYGS